MFILFVFISGVNFTFFPSIELDDIYVEYKTKPGTSIEKTKDYADKIVQKIQIVESQLSDSLGSEVFKEIEIKLGPNSHNGEVQIFMTPPEERGIEAFKIVEMLRTQLDKVNDLDDLIIGLGDPFGKPLAFALTGNDIDELEEASILFTKNLKQINGVAAAKSDYEYGPNEINFELNQTAKSLGLSNYDIFYQVRQSFLGTQIQDLQTSDDEMQLWIRMEDDNNDSFSSLENLKIKSQKGLFPLKELVNISIDNKIISINRKNRKNIIEIEGELASSSSYSSDIINEVESVMFPKIKNKFPSVNLELSGSSDEGTVTANSMKKIMPVFSLLILCIVLITFRSKAQTIVVFILMPFTLIECILVICCTVYQLVFYQDSVLLHL